LIQETILWQMTACHLPVFLFLIIFRKKGLLWQQVRQKGQNQRRGRKNLALFPQALETPAAAAANGKSSPLVPPVVPLVPQPRDGKNLHPKWQSGLSLSGQLSF
jgi:hypothetical protein